MTRRTPTTAADRVPATEPERQASAAERSLRPTIANVARLAGVSASTASVVFSGKAPVSEATRGRVQAAAAQLGYAGPDPRAAALRRGRSGIVGVVLEEHLRTAFLDPVKTAMMDGLTEAVSSLDAGLLLLRDDAAAGGAALLSSAPMDAVVLIGCSGRVDETLEAIRARRLPAVVIEGDAGEEVPRIELDNRAAAARIAEHLRELGHERVAIVTLPLGVARERGEVSPAQRQAATVPVARERLDGVREIFPDAPAFAAGGSFIDEGVRAAAEIFSRYPAPQRPTAIIAQSDLLAAGVIRAAEEAGLRVPEDLSVAGFDGIAVDGIGGRVLTTAVQPAVQKGRAAGEAVARLLDGEKPESVLLTCTFRPGTTTAPPAHRPRPS